MTLRERIEGLRARAKGWTEADLSKFPTATLELIDALAAALVAEGPSEAPDLRTRLEKLHKWVFDDTFEGKERHVELVELSKVLDLLAAAPSRHKEAPGDSLEQPDQHDQPQPPTTTTIAAALHKEGAGGERMTVAQEEAQLLARYDKARGSLTGNQLKEIALKHRTIVAGFEFADRFDFDAIAAELNAAASPAGRAEQEPK